jgi:hypothetical protein
VPSWIVSGPNCSRPSRPRTGLSLKKVHHCRLFGVIGLVGIIAVSLRDLPPFLLRQHLVGLGFRGAPGVSAAGPSDRVRELVVSTGMEVAKARRPVFDKGPPLA